MPKPDVVTHRAGNPTCSHEWAEGHRSVSVGSPRVYHSVCQRCGLVEMRYRFA